MVTPLRSLTLPTVSKLARERDAPLEDFLLMALNVDGIRYASDDGEEPGFHRGRFLFRPLGATRSFIATSLSEDTPFRHDGCRILLGGVPIGDATPIENDTCEDTYLRKGGTVLSLNSNNKSACAGCAFCGAYSLEAREETLTDGERLDRKVRELIRASGKSDISHLESIGVVTGCFRSEEEAFGHLLLVRGVFGNHGFRGEINYLGSQITSPWAIDALARDGRYGLYLTVECFDRRERFLRPSKAAVSLDRGRNILHYAKSQGLETTFLYILGLDPLERIAEEFPKYVGTLTRHPIVNLLQIYTPRQTAVRHPDAMGFEYYLDGRSIIEEAMAPTGLRPRTWENYRAPWATRYRGEPLEHII
jgi:hypothetical protein